ncbi:MAG: electron transfer flavoprotein subunit alpha/FixB family protein [Syntrophaceae bacterium]|nr:electron transfer flavoprotein subunit alpha/FixB family protein [Syntrophaceae bacterium]
MAGILIYSDQDRFGFELLTAARSIAEKTGAAVKAVSINNPGQAEALAGRGADTCRVEGGDIRLEDTAAVARVLKKTVEALDVDVVLLSSNRRGKELAGRLAQMLDAGCLTDVSALEVRSGRIECTRNALGGATVAVQAVTTPRKVIALAAKAFAAAPEGAGRISDLALDVKGSGIRLLESRTRAGDAVQIEVAPVLVVVGCGLENREDLAIVNRIAAALKGEVACSKPVATDRKWLSEDRVVGLSGKICKPELALLLGVSGQVQFMVGIRDAGTIVAVNRDENANVMQCADYVMTVDLNDILQELDDMLGGAAH